LSVGYSKKVTLNLIFRELLLRPLIAGLFGFSLFFTTVLICQIVGLLIGEEKILFVEISDVYFSLLGLGLAFLIRLLSNVAKIKGEN